MMESPLFLFRRFRTGYQNGPELASLCPKMYNIDGFKINHHFWLVMIAMGSEIQVNNIIDSPRPHAILHALVLAPPLSERTAGYFFSSVKKLE